MIDEYYYGYSSMAHFNQDCFYLGCMDKRTLNTHIARENRAYLDGYCRTSLLILGRTDRGNLYYDYRRNKVFISKQFLWSRASVTLDLEFKCNVKSDYHNYSECFQAIPIYWTTHKESNQTLLMGLKPKNKRVLSIGVIASFRHDTLVRSEQSFTLRLDDIQDYLILCGTQMLIVKGIELLELSKRAGIEIKVPYDANTNNKRIPVLGLGEITPHTKKKRLSFERGVVFDYDGLDTFENDASTDVSPHKVKNVQNLKYVKSKGEDTACYTSLDLADSQLDTDAMHYICNSETLSGVTSLTFPDKLEYILPIHKPEALVERPINLQAAFSVCFFSSSIARDSFSAPMWTFKLPSTMKGVLPDLSHIKCSSLVIPEGITDIYLDYLPMTYNTTVSELRIEGTPTLRSSSVKKTYSDWHRLICDPVIIKNYILAYGGRAFYTAFRYLKYINDIELEKVYTELEAGVLIMGGSVKGRADLLEQYAQAFIVKLFAS